jgi:THO complex subunit 2
VPATSLTKPPKQDLTKDESRSGKAVGRTSGPSAGDKDLPTHASEGRQVGTTNASSAVTANGNTVSASAKGSTPSARAPSDVHGNESKAESGASKSSDMRVSSVKEDGAEVSDVPRPTSSRVVHSPRHDSSTTASKSSDKLQKRASPAEEPDRLGKRRKGDSETRDLEGDVRFSDRERSVDHGIEEHRLADKSLDRSKDKGSERYDRDYRERVDRPDKSRGDDVFAEKSRDRSMERYGRERSVERVQERGTDRSFDRLSDKAKDDRNKDDRSKLRYNDTSVEKSHVDDRFHGQSLPPPPPLPPNVVPQSVNTGRRDEDADRRFGATRHMQRLSPRHEEKERRRSEENSVVLQDDAKRRRDDDFRERKREDREVLSMKVCISCVIY